MTKQIPTEIMEHKYAHLWKQAWKRPHLQNKQFSTVFVASPGSGKSWSALSLADLLEQGNFDVNRIAFSASQFARLVSKNWPTGTTLVLDDAGLALFSRDSMTRIVKNLSKTLQSCRYKNLILLLTLPNLTMLDKSVQRILDSLIEIRGVDFKRQETIGKFYWLQSNVFSGKVYRHSPLKVVFTDSIVGGKNRHVLKSPFVRFAKPRPELILEYEKRKKFYLDQRNIEAANELEELEKPKHKRLTFNELVVLAKERKADYTRKGFILDELIMADLGCGVKMAAKIRKSLV